MRALPLLFLILVALFPGLASAQPGSSDPPSGVEGYERADGSLDWERLDADLAPHRRSDGTLNWESVSADRPAMAGAGLAQFGLALFLKELAVVAQTGDRSRIEEFYEGLLSVDFFVHYGAFLTGAGGAEIAYARFLAQHVRPQFVKTLLRNNLILASGLALSRVVAGEFDGKAFAISLSALGLSSTAVRAGLSGVEWVVNLKKAARVGRTVGRLGRVARALSGVGGWAYVAGELTIVLLTADAIEKRVHAALDRRAARAAVADAGVAFLEAVQRAPDEASVLEATEAYADAWDAYRTFLYRPLLEVEATLAKRMERAARKAKLAADRRAATLSRLREHPTLLDSLARRHGSLDAYADTLVAEEIADLDASLRRFSEAYGTSRDQALRTIYDAPRRAERLLDGVDVAEALAANGPGRTAQRKRLRSALKDASRNRLQTYEDQAEVLAAARALTEHHGPLSAQEEAVARALRADRSLSSGDLAGLAGALAGQ